MRKTGGGFGTVVNGAGAAVDTDLVGPGQAELPYTDVLVAVRRRPGVALGPLSPKLRQVRVQTALDVGDRGEIVTMARG